MKKDLGNNAREGFTPLSQSVIWRLQKRFYQESGISAWEPNAVPSYITTNTFIARCYARVMGGFFGDYGRTATTGKGEETRRYIFELGAGTGRFAYRFLKYFLHEREKLPSSGADIVYVMTDISEATIGFWRRHPDLVPFVEAGLLDFARLDVLDEQPIRLLVSDRKITPGSLKTPIAVIANYVIDSLPHDLFSLEDGILKVRLVRHEIADDCTNIADLVRETIFEYREEDCPPSPYGREELNRLLDHYRKAGGSLNFSLPVGGFQMMARMTALTSGPVFFLCGDFGVSHLPSIRELPPRRVARNGTYSVHVNFHALGEYAHARRGRVFLPDMPKSSLEVAGFLFQAGRRQPAALMEQFDQHVSEFGPDEFFMLKKSVEDHLSQLPISRILALLRISGWDTKIFNAAVPAILKELPRAGRAAQDAVVAAVKKVDEMHFRCDSTTDPLPAILNILVMLDERETAFEILRANEPLLRRTEEGCLVMAETYRLFGEETEAGRIVEALLADTPDHPQGKALRARLQRDAAVSGTA